MKTSRLIRGHQLHVRLSNPRMHAATKPSLKSVTGFFRLFTAVCVFGSITMLVGFHLLNSKASYPSQPHNMVLNTGVAPIRLITKKPKDVVRTASHQNSTSVLFQLNSTSVNQTLIDVSLHCKTVCSKYSGSLCVRLDLAIFVYKANIPTKNMRFDLQGFYPVVRLPRQNNNTTSSVVEVEKCNLEEHYPGVELIPRQGTCALVGNSGILNNSSCGDYIDSHDFVIRTNMGVIKGYEDDVGRTANLTVINMSLISAYGTALAKSNDPKQSAIRDRFFDYIRNLNNLILWYPKVVFQAGKIGRSGRSFQTIIEAVRKNRSSDMRFAFSWKSINIEKAWGLRRYGTLGFDAYAAAQTFCSNITLFGFYPFYKDLEGRDVKYHYFDDVKYDFSSKKANHDFVLEHKKLKELEKQGKLKLVVSDCKPRKPQTAGL